MSRLLILGIIFSLLETSCFPAPATEIRSLYGMNKFNLASRAALMRFALRTGLISAG